MCIAFASSEQQVCSHQLAQAVCLLYRYSRIAAAKGDRGQRPQRKCSILFSTHASYGLHALQIATAEIPQLPAHRRPEWQFCALRLG